MMQSLGTPKVTTLKWLKSMKREDLVYKTLAHRPNVKRRPKGIYPSNKEPEEDHLARL